MYDSAIFSLNCRSFNFYFDAVPIDVTSGRYFCLYTG